MVKRGPEPKKIIDDMWRPELAYAVGLLTADGCISKDGLLIDLTSKDKEQLKNYLRCLGIKVRIGKKWNSQKYKSYRVQFKNRIFYNFLLNIGLYPKKSLTIEKVAVPQEFFFDFLRGLFDGDGCTYSYWDSRWKSSFMFYVSFASGSKKFVDWLRIEIKDKIKISGHIGITYKKNPFYQLRYSKNEAVKLVSKMYERESLVFLKRKKLKIKKALSIIRHNKQI